MCYSPDISAFGGLMWLVLIAVGEDGGGGRG